jgi:hypothetical protein
MTARYPAKTYIPNYDGDFVITEANGTMSREQVLLLRGVRVEAGTVLGKVTASGLYAPLNLAAVDGSQNAAAVLRDHRDALAGADTRRGVVMVRNCDLNGKKLIWPSGITVNQRKAAEAQLAATSVLVRY